MRGLPVTHTPEDIEALERSVQIALQALMEIAAYGDARANEHLRATGSYGRFDEPHAVQKARETIDQIGGVG